MKTLTIKEVGRPGSDTRLFRAYADFGSGKEQWTNITCSTTGHTGWAIIRCAAKAFIKFEEPKAESAEIETRIKITSVSESPAIWRAELEAK